MSLICPTKAEQLNTTFEHTQVRTLNARLLSKMASCDVASFIRLALAAAAPTSPTRRGGLVVRAGWFTNNDVGPATIELARHVLPRVECLHWKNALE
jgi:hypothetical protein